MRDTAPTSVSRSVVSMALAVAVLAVMLTGCGSSSDEGANGGTIEPTDTTVEDRTASTGTDNDTGGLSQITLTEVADLSSPIAIAFRPSTGTPYVAEREGRLVFFPDGFEDSDRPDVAIDLTGDVGELEGEQGLLGIAFTPDGAELVVNHTEQGSDGGTVVKIFGLNDDGTLDAASERILLRIDQPFSNHNGGHVTFGPDGFLYVGMGDGGSQGDPGDNGQDPSTFLGALLRIDPLAEGSDPYAIPEGNPFVDGSGRAEVMATGLRNPWRFSFDRETGDLWLADVGDSEIEEVNRVPISELAGANFGWPVFEGTRRNRDGETASTPTAPVYEYDHTAGSSITGGFVYRGEELDGWGGSYVYSDYVAGGLARVDTGGQEFRSTPIEIDDEPTSIVSFGEDLDGEIYVISLEGRIWKLTSAGA